MGKPKEAWKGVFIDREFLKVTIRHRFTRMAKGKLEEEIGALVNDLERYFTAELFANTSEIVGGLISTLEEARTHYKEFAEGIDEKIIQRRAQQMMDEKGKEE